MVVLLTPQIVAREATIFGCSVSNNWFTNQSSANVCVCGVKKSVELDFQEPAVRGGRLTLHTCLRLSSRRCRQCGLAAATGRQLCGKLRGQLSERSKTSNGAFNVGCRAGI